MNLHAQAPALEVSADAASTRIPWGFAEWFVISQTVLPAVLILPGTQAFRLPIRMSAFLLPLGAFVWWNLNSEVSTLPPRAQSWVFAIMILLGFMLFHPTTPSFVGGLAHVAVYFAVMTPLFWAPAFVRTPEHLARLLWILLICCGVNAVVGVLQVYDPGRWMPAEFSRITLANAMALGPLSYTGPNGQLIVRPPGLFDTPGAVAGPAAYATLLGIVFAVSALPSWKRLLSLVFAGAGLAAIYLSQVRISIVTSVGMLIVFALVAARQGRAGRAVRFVILSVGLVVGAFMLAMALGGQSVHDRFMTLFANDPLSVYQTARGTQLDVTFGDLFVNHPLGSGLGRWGMVANYFGSFTPNLQSIWAEIQLTGWMIDGGVIMIVLYSGAIIVTALSEYRVAVMTRFPRLAQCAAVVLAANLGTAALIFSFTPFVTQVGIQYWFLAGALHGVAQRYGVDAA
jgi:hypothetical protein